MASPQPLHRIGLRLKRLPIFGNLLPPRVIVTPTRVKLTPTRVKVPADDVQLTPLCHKSPSTNAQPLPTPVK